MLFSFLSDFLYFAEFLQIPGLTSFWAIRASIGCLVAFRLSPRPALDMLDHGRWAGFQHLAELEDGSQDRGLALLVQAD